MVPLAISRLFILSISLLFLPIISSTTPDNSVVLNNFIKCLKSSNSNISAAIFTAENTSFPSILISRIDNRRYSTPQTPKPLAIIAAKDEFHVNTTILCAKRHNLQLRIRSGGHDFESISSVSGVPFVILDMFNLRSIDINIAEETAWVQAGASLGELYHKIANTSGVHGFSASVCPAVCSGGHFSGGGYGPMMRKYGLTVDNILDARIMDVNGQILDRKSMGEDVFWAIRGGGGASFGVILSWKIKLSRVPPKVTVFNVQRSEIQGSLEAFYRWQYVAPNLPNEVFIRAETAVVNGSGEGNKTIGVSFIGLYLGQAQELVSLLEKRFPELGLEKKECFEMSWVESTVFWADYPVGTSLDVLLRRLNGPTQFYKIKSDYVKRPIPKEALKSIWETMIKIGQGWIKWNPYGGRMSEIPEWETPFPHRAGNLALIQYFVNWFEEGNEIANHYLNLSRELYQKMAPFVSENPREAFLNYRDLDIGENPDNITDFGTALVYGRKYFTSNFERLVKAKTIIDPDNFFRNGQSIPPLPKK
ncbi:Xanthine dehydrogenase C subunit [Parasponia andersonii]|uniref:Xanthine dehydrogenase C subunit n=1 Tax=Parasponia andersonii TaxID=3476 RepID=A0A2P5AQT0_PARAD|nr:Xanthine dehydrogenase C subunit [Parasponia andersonii]